MLANHRPAPHPRLNGHLLLQTQFLPRRLLPLALGDGLCVSANEVEQNVRHVMGDDRPGVQGVLAGPLGPLRGGQHSAGMLANGLPAESRGGDTRARSVFLLVQTISDLPLHQMLIGIPYNEALVLLVFGGLLS